jgi:hypothetical protein
MLIPRAFQKKAGTFPPRRFDHFRQGGTPAAGAAGLGVEGGGACLEVKLDGALATGAGPIAAA